MWSRSASIFNAAPACAPAPGLVRAQMSQPFTRKNTSVSIPIGSTTSTTNPNGNWLGDAVGVEIDPNALLFSDKQGRAIREMQQAA